MAGAASHIVTATDVERTHFVAVAAAVNACVCCGALSVVTRPASGLRKGRHRGAAAAALHILITADVQQTDSAAAAAAVNACVCCGTFRAVIRPAWALEGC
jgi:hypothetical protein